jgi:hypothetical protein
MYSLLRSNQKPDEQTIENAFDGNICRCTGNRFDQFSVHLLPDIRNENLSFLPSKHD